MEKDTVWCSPPAVHNSSHLLCTEKEQGNILCDTESAGGRMRGEKREAHTPKTQGNLAEAGRHDNHR